MLSKRFNDSHLWYLIFLCILYIFLKILFVRMPGGLFERCVLLEKTVLFLPLAWNFYQILCASVRAWCVCLHVLDTNIVWILTAIIIIGLQLWILIKDIPLHLRQSFQRCSFICLPFARILGWQCTADWDVFTCVLYYTKYVALRGISSMQECLIQ